MNIADYSRLDIQKTAAIIGIKEKHVSMLIKSFIQESDTILSNLEDAITKKDYEMIDHNAHSIKGSAGSLRFNEIHEMAKSMELAGKSSDISFEYEETLNAIKKSIATICI